jgi:flagellar basal-body rod modification protein FlgD
MVDTVLNSSILTSNQYRAQQNASALAEQDLGRDAFLKLLTTQLTNQSPLDPMDNEAFVAQLAQFSSVEGIKGMQASLENMVSGMRQEQMVSGANLVGKKVVIEGGSFIGGNNEDSVGTVNLSGEADSLSFNIYDSATGELVYSETKRNVNAGSRSLSWDGRSKDGSVLPYGAYTMTASAQVDGKTIPLQVTTTAEVRSVKWNPQLQHLHSTDRCRKN